MATLTNSDFMSPYEVSKYLSGIIEGKKKNKQTFLTDQFGDRDVTEDKSVNLDKLRDEKNVMGEYVHPKADPSLIELPDYGTVELGFAYSKEGINTDDFVTLNQREAGQPFGQVDVNANDASRLQKKLANALQAFDNLKEKAASDILVSAAHTASGPKASTVVWNFGRTVATTDTEYLAGTDVYAIDLTTLSANGGTGKRAWDSTGGTKAPTPYLDVKKMVQSAANRGKMLRKLIMSTNAYDLLEADINANFKTAADTTILTMQRIELKILPEVEAYDGVMYRRTLSLGSASVDIYTYTAAYNDRLTGASASYFPSGYVVGIPDTSNQFVRYGRIMHRKARWAAMPVWINTWDDGKTGEIQQELHTSFVLGIYDANAVISWKVAA